MLAMTERKPKGSGDTTHHARDLPKGAKTAPVMVENPLGYFGAKIEVLRSTRDDPLAALLARYEIDQAQYEAGRLYEKYAEQAEIGNVKAMDPAKEAVDGGFIPEPITDRQIAAVRQLSEAARVLGRRGEIMIRHILIHRRRFKEIAKTTKESDVMHARKSFFDCLEELAELWGLASERRLTGREQITHK